MRKRENNMQSRHLSGLWKFLALTRRGDIGCLWWKRKVGRARDGPRKLPRRRRPSSRRLCLPQSTRPQPQRRLNCRHQPRWRPRQRPSQPRHRSRRRPQRRRQPRPLRRPKRQHGRPGRHRPHTGRDAAQLAQKAFRMNMTTEEAGKIDRHDHRVRAPDSFHSKMGAGTEILLSKTVLTSRVPMANGRSHPWICAAWSHRC